MKYVIGALLSVVLFTSGARAQNFAIGDSTFLLDGKPFVIRCGEMHFARIPRAYWRQRLKMAKAMGLNTVCAYLFWNYTEKEPGTFDWGGNADAAEFCRIAQQEGLFVILRPGPYSCAEWEMGGFPWWLLKDKSIALRTRNPHYLHACRQYLLEVGRQLAPLQITRGGNIIMVQVENEYGSYGSDRAYIGDIRDDLKKAGFTVPFFTCDPTGDLANDIRPDIFAAVNFGSHPENAFKTLRKLEPRGPLMCAEYYPGWFDSWGQPHHTGSADAVVKDLKWMLDHKASFSIYMVHGGTTFGTYSGANAPPYAPETSSYDYDAPIDESGHATAKFYAIRDLLSKYLQEGEALPDVPAAPPAQTISPVRFDSVASLWSNLPPAVHSDTPLLMEDLNQGFGAVLYRTTLGAGSADTLRFKDIHDYALVCLDGHLLGALDRRAEHFAIAVPARSTAARLDILVEATGRVNYGPLILDRKGIHGDVTLGSRTIKGWTQFPIALGDKTLPVTYGPLTEAPGFYKAKFSADEQKDTYLDMRKWNKGLVWVNGKCLGHYWNIGPTQTMYLPGCWLRKGKNEVVVFDLYGVAAPELQGLDKPILNDLHVQPAR